MDIVNDEYWLGYAKKSVDESATRLNDAAAKITTLTATFWVLYTATFVIGTTLKKIEEPWYVMLLLVSPIGLMIFAYLLALWAQMPRLGSAGIDLRIPDDIQAFYNANIKLKKRRLTVAMGITVLSAVALAGSLILANFTREKAAAPTPVANTLGANFIGSQNKLLVIGDIPDKTVVTLKLDQVGSPSVKEVWKSTSMAYKNNHFEYLIDLPAKPGKYLATVTWEEGDDPKIVHMLTKEVEVKAEKKAAK